MNGAAFYFSIKGVTPKTRAPPRRSLVMSSGILSLVNFFCEWTFQTLEGETIFRLKIFFCSKDGNAAFDGSCRSARSGCSAGGK